MSVQHEPGRAPTLRDARLWRRIIVAALHPWRSARARAHIRRVVSHLPKFQASLPRHDDAFYEPPGLLHE